MAARPAGELPAGLKDSKLLTKIQREKILDLLSICCDFGEGWVKAGEIDKYGVTKALKLGARRALSNLSAGLDEEIIIDGNFNYLPKKYHKGRALIGADNLVPAVSAASIHAKVTRDRFMVQLAKKYPIYKFEDHVGYGTKTHMLAIKEHGAVKYIHRYSYAPINRLAGV